MKKKNNSRRRLKRQPSGFVLKAMEELRGNAKKTNPPPFKINQDAAKWVRSPVRKHINQP